MNELAAMWLLIVIIAELGFLIGLMWSLIKVTAGRR